MNTSQEIADRIKEIAKSKDISLGAMFTELGMSKNTLSSMCSGGRFPVVDKLAKIADYLDCSIDYLLGRTETKRIVKLPDDIAKEAESIYLKSKNVFIPKEDIIKTSSRKTEKRYYWINEGGDKDKYISVYDSVYDFYNGDVFMSKQEYMDLLEFDDGFMARYVVKPIFNVDRCYLLSQKDYDKFCEIYKLYAKTFIFEKKINL